MRTVGRLRRSTSGGGVRCACLRRADRRRAARRGGRPRNVGAPWVVSLGDSAISGEAGRWAGNTNQDSSEIDALGPTAYYDNANNTAEQIPGCHRSKSAEVYIGGGVNGLNLACSGAHTGTQPYSSGNDFKPGLDFYNDGAGHLGQALMLQQFAASHNVKTVAVLIGANNYHFADIVQTCVEDWLTSPTLVEELLPRRQQHHRAVHVRERRRPDGQHQGRDAERPSGNGECRIRRLVLHDPGADLLGSDPARRAVPLQRVGWTRQSTGGCGLWNADANWANDTAFATINNSVRNAVTQAALPNVKLLDISQIANGPPVVREHGRPARGEGPDLLDAAGAPPTRPSGSTRSVLSARSSAARISCKRTCTPTTGASSRCATACARHTTAAPTSGSCVPARAEARTPRASRTSP